MNELNVNSKSHLKNSSWEYGLMNLQLGLENRHQCKILKAEIRDKKIGYHMCVPLVGAELLVGQLAGQYEALQLLSHERTHSCIKKIEFFILY